MLSSRAEVYFTEVFVEAFICNFLERALCDPTLSGVQPGVDDTTIFL